MLLGQLELCIPRAATALASRMWPWHLQPPGTALSWVLAARHSFFIAPLVYHQLVLRWGLLPELSKLHTPLYSLGLYP